MEEVILVNEQDQEIGRAEKLEAHQKGLLHRAFSVFVFNSKGEWLLQQRALHKYHSAGLWSNTCCSHPKPEESTLDAAYRRCKEEMGIHPTVQHAFSFIYKVELDHGLTEHEYDHVFIGKYEDNPLINAEEVAAYQWISTDKLLADVEKHPARYTTWFRLCLERVIAHHQKNYEA